MGDSIFISNRFCAISTALAVLMVAFTSFTFSIQLFVHYRQQKRYKHGLLCDVEASDILALLSIGFSDPKCLFNLPKVLVVFYYRILGQ
jgi:mannose/fructose/N-acetylgalactosamine-specific phosphotransferase system component IIC